MDEYSTESILVVLRFVFDLLHCEASYVQLQWELKVVIDFVASHRLEVPVESFEGDHQQTGQFR